MFEKVFDGRHRRIRGLWQRGGIFYVQMRAAGHKTPARIRIQDATTVAQANAAMQALKLKRAGGGEIIQKVHGIPTFTALANSYLEELRSMGSKKPTTIARESSGISALKSFMGDKRVNAITMKDVFAFAAWRRAKVSGRAVDVNVTALRHVMAKAVREGHIRSNPIGKWSALADPPAKVRLMANAEIQRMRRTAVAILPLSGRQFSDYLELLRLSGGREQETLALRWSMSVDFKRKLLGFGQGDLAEHSKNSDSRWVPMNKRLEKHLRAMHRQRNKESDWLFPSRIGGPDYRTTSFKKARLAVMRSCQIEDFGFHHLRHFFISNCVMSGVDFMTLASWVGHSDGGVLIGKVYGHIDNKHSRRQAAAVKF
jgi:integrase